MSAHVPDESVLESYHYTRRVPGKNVRGLLLDSFQLWMKAEKERVEEVKRVVTQLHEASLMVDDIEDDSKVRRGIPAAHTVFGVGATLNAANYVYFLAMQRVMDMGCEAATRLFLAEVLNLHRGQGQDIKWRNDGSCPSVAAYEQMVKDKTGGLFRLAIGLLRTQSSLDSPPDVSELVDDLSLYFQIRDDLLNLCSPEYMKSKVYCEDITEGKFSYPVIHAVQQSEDSTELLSILRQRTESDVLKRHAVKIMEKAGSFVATYAYLGELHDRVLSSIAALGGNPMLAVLVSKLHKGVLACEPHLGGLDAGGASPGGDAPTKSETADASA